MFDGGFGIAAQNESATMYASLFSSFFMQFTVRSCTPSMPSVPVHRFVQPPHVDVSQ
jgi:hypothetical protein